jgi:hypothetical protein
VIIRPTLATTQGRALFIGTPSGFANLYDLHMMGQDPKNVDWMSWQFTTADSPFVSAAELESAKTDMDPKQYAQEFLAQFVNMSGRVYGFFDRKIHIKSCPFNPNLPICIGQDFNISPMSGVCAQIQPNGEVWVVDEVVRHDSSVSDVCDVLESKYWRWIDKCIIYPDPAGSSRSHARGESALQIFQERGFKNIRAFRKAPLIVDRVAAVNRMLENAKGEYRLFFDPSCVRTIASIDQTVYRQGTNEVDKKQSVEHSSDALGYFISFEFPVRKHTITGLSM